jgi:AraC-like DNA-binding protein
MLDLAATGDYHTLSSSHYSHAELPVASRRIQKLKDYIDCHYHEEIRMETLSELVNMTPNALSRFFKQRTNRSISGYINEVRIAQATSLLTSSAMTVVEISYKCGFNTISNFNRIFKSIKGVTPTEFRDSYHKNAYLI